MMSPPRRLARHGKINYKISSFLVIIFRMFFLDMATTIGKLYLAFHEFSGLRCFITHALFSILSGEAAQTHLFATAGRNFNVNFSSKAE